VLQTAAFRLCSNHTLMLSSFHALKNLLVPLSGFRTWPAPYMSFKFSRIFGSSPLFLDKRILSFLWEQQHSRCFRVAIDARSCKCYDSINPLVLLQDVHKILRNCLIFCPASFTLLFVPDMAYLTAHCEQTTRWPAFARLRGIQLCLILWGA
jgi:hypothetical protein